MGTAEGVIDIQVAKFCQLLCEGWIVLLFFRMEAQVLQQQHLAGLQHAHHFLRSLSHAVWGETDIYRLAEAMSEKLTQAIDDRAQAHLGIWLSLGTAEMRSQNHFGAVTNGVFQRGQRLTNARVIHDLSAIFRERDVEVYTDEDVLMFQGKISNR